MRVVPERGLLAAAPASKRWGGKFAGSRVAAHFFLRALAALVCLAAVAHVSAAVVLPGYGEAPGS